MASSSALTSVIVASAQSVAKVFAIGAVGFFAVKLPRKAPLLPSKAVGTVARFSFHVLVLPLIYSTIANSLTPQTIGDYWPLLLAALAVLIISFLTSTVLAVPFCFQNASDVRTLRIAATFPNVVALPILIFPSLCEYRVVYESFSTTEEADLYTSCVTISNTFIFLYFFAWSLLFWSFASRSLVVGASRNEAHTLFHSIQQGILQTLKSPGFVAMVLGFVTACIPPLREALFEPAGYLRFLGASIQSLALASSPISTMVVAASLVPSASSSSSTGGSANTRTTAGESPDGTEDTDDNDVENDVACSNLAVSQCNDNGDGDNDGKVKATTTSGEETSTTSRGGDEEQGALSQVHSTVPEPVTQLDVDDMTSIQHQEDADIACDSDGDNNGILHESPFMSDPNFGPNQLRRRSSIARFRQSLSRRRISLRNKTTTRTTMQEPPRSKREMRKLFVWFTLSRLIVTPAIVVSLIVALDSVWQGPALAKLVIIINSALPGALIVVVLLKSQPSMSDSAAVVAKVYLPSYLLSIVTIAAWTAVGLWISLPDQ